MVSVEHSRWRPVQWALDSAFLALVRLECFGICAKGVQMTLSSSAVEWALQFVAEHSDGDLFPPVDEVTALLSRRREFAAAVTSRQLKDIEPGPARRFIVPKDEISYRQATQLEPQD
jgi:hypothetical protein